MSLDILNQISMRVNVLDDEASPSQCDYVWYDGMGEPSEGQRAAFVEINAPGDFDHLLRLSLWDWSEHAKGDGCTQRACVEITTGKARILAQRLLFACEQMEARP